MQTGTRPATPRRVKSFRSAAGKLVRSTRALATIPICYYHRGHPKFHIVPPFRGCRNTAAIPRARVLEADVRRKTACTTPVLGSHLYLFGLGWLCGWYCGGGWRVSVGYGLGDAGHILVGALLSVVRSVLIVGSHHAGFGGRMRCLG
ncbi:uncharacterized protein LAJ45_10161 [Morchella importuna]|uniref:uncharacterized protein n=1 Tax=Morchella importuna TaxID=1174673 RepID=UPI001E8DC71A|nr:uncharacterized protein LAJ45_10161 [Morchella importuna]KAH8145836.1 hypothetical protein LAJ45_10161 [Morchella importuna]